MDPLAADANDPPTVPYWRPSPRLRWALGLALALLLASYLGMQAPHVAAFLSPTSTPTPMRTAGAQVRYHFAALAPIALGGGVGGAVSRPGSILAITWIAIPEGPATTADGTTSAGLRSLLIGPYATLGEVRHAMDAPTLTPDEAMRAARVLSAETRTPLTSDVGGITVLVLPSDLSPGWYRHLDLATTVYGVTTAERTLLVEAPAPGS